MGNLNTGTVITGGGDVHIGDVIINKATYTSLTDDQKYRVDLLYAHWHRYNELIVLKTNEKTQFELTLNLGYIHHKQTKSSNTTIVVSENIRDAKRIDALNTFFQANEGRLLIFGEAAILVLQLAKRLIQQAAKEVNDGFHSFPVPIILNAASWRKGEYTNFQEWLATAIVQYSAGVFSITLHYAQELVKNCKILPLLDGFDEIPDPEKASFVAGLSGYMAMVIGRTSGIGAPEYPQFLIASRVEAKTHLTFLAKENRCDTAEIQPFSKEQVKSFLTNGKFHGSERIRLSEKLETDKPLAKALTSAFYICICLEMLTDTKETDFDTTITDVTKKRKKIVDLYMTQELQKMTEPKKSEQYLAWLAYHTKEHKKSSTFELVDLQRTWDKMKKDLLPSLISYTFFSLLPVIIFGGFFDTKKTRGFITICLLLSLFLFVARRLSLKEEGHLTVIEPIERLKLKLPKDIVTKIWGLFNFTSPVFGGTLSLALIFQIIPILVSPNLSNILYLTFSSILMTATIVFTQGIFTTILDSSLVSKKIISANTPYQRFKRSLINEFWVISLPTLLAVLLFVYLLGVHYKASGLEIVAAMIFTFCVLVLMLLSLYFSFSKHGILRVSLWRSGYLPISLVAFLDSATPQSKKNKVGVGILLREGGSWRFRHQLLQDWLAEKLPKEKQSPYIASTKEK